MHGDVERVLPRLIKKNKPDLIIANPPRIGLSKSVTQSLLQSECREIIYVSCMPSTLARDLSLLCKEKYRVQECIAFDMFPQTAHVETLVHLIAKEDYPAKN